MLNRLRLMKKETNTNNDGERFKTASTVVLQGSYSNGVLTTSTGHYPAILSPNTLKLLNEKTIDISLPTLFVCSPITKPLVFEYEVKEQKPYLGFVINSIVTKAIGIGTVDIVGKVFYEANSQKDYDYILIRVGQEKLKINGRLIDSNGDSINCFFRIRANIVGNSLVVKDSQRLTYPELRHLKVV